MNYFVLSTKVERGCPIALIEDAKLYDQYYEELKKAPEVGSYPWYSYKTSQTCALPANACLISKSRSYDFDIRQLRDNIYVVSHVFLQMANEMQITFLDMQPIEVKSRQGKTISSKSYYIIRFEQTNFETVASLENSKYTLDPPLYIFEKIVIQSSCQLPLFLIKNAVPVQDTFFCSELFLECAKKHHIKGVNFFECGEAPWQDPNNVLGYLMVDDYSTDDEVWPI